MGKLEIQLSRYSDLIVGITLLLINLKGLDVSSNALGDPAPSGESAGRIRIQSVTSPFASTGGVGAARRY